MTGLALGLMLITGYVDHGITADGSPVAVGVAACPRRLAFGTTLEIEGVGTVVCHDRTPGNPELIDVWVPTLPEAYGITGRRAVWLVSDDAPDGQQ